MRKDYNDGQIKQFASIWLDMCGGLKDYNNSNNGHFVYAEDIIDEMSRVQRRFTLRDWDRFIDAVLL